MHSLGFTGTRIGMTELQRARVFDFLRVHYPIEVHHGDCIGADAQFAHIIWWHFKATKIISHPSQDPTYRAHTAANILLPELPYLQRDRNIVQASDHLLATPRQDKRPKSLRGEGTWYTINYAQEKGIPVTIILPNGDLLSMMRRTTLRIRVALFDYTGR